MELADEVALVLDEERHRDAVGDSPRKTVAKRSREFTRLTLRGPGAA